MKIAGIQNVTLLDYPDKVAAIIFTKGCNFKCPFCHNSQLIVQNGEECISDRDVINYLQKRKNVLDGLVISGGEPTIWPDLINFIEEVKGLGLLVKLDTNGSNPSMLSSLINNKLVDYVAMDIKNDLNCYDKITGFSNVSIENIKKSIEILKNSGVDHEFRTTISKEFHDRDKIKNIINYIGNKEKYFIQNVEISDNVLDKTLTSFTDEELKDFQRDLLKYSNNIKFRNLYN